MACYTDLNARHPKAFLIPEDFRTDSDTWPVNIASNLAVTKYQEGLKISREARRVYIMSDGCWGADRLNGGLTTSYEGIGYHAGTADLLRGFLDGPAEFGVFRGSDYTIIKPAK